MYKQLLLTLLFAFQIYTISDAQVKKVKFGKISQTELESKISPIDSNAHAEVLYTKGDTRFLFSSQGLKIETTVHSRVKIYDKEGYGHSDINVHYYEGKESVSNIKAYTYNLDGDNVVKTKLEKTGIFTEKASKNHRIKKFTLPDIKEGSIIEYKYRITSDFFFHLRPWGFQRNIPVRYTCYTVVIPEDIIYSHNLSGYEAIERVKKGTVINGIYANEYIYTGHNIPAFPNENFISCRHDYLSKIEFELQSTKTNGMFRDYTGNWKTIHKSLMNNPNFGLAMKRKAAVKKLLPEIIKDCQNDNEKIKSIFEFVRKTILWNESYSIYAYRKYNKILQEKSGNSGEINLFLITMLKTAGIKCDPVIISTRDNGRIKPGAPNISKYNHCICCVHINDEDIMLDATDDHTSIDLIPYNDYNDIGVIINDQNAETISLKNTKVSSKYVTINASYKENGQMTGNLIAKYNNYKAHSFRKSYSNDEDNISDIEKSMEELSLQNYKTQNLKDKEKDIIESYDFTLGEDDELPSSLYLNPLLFFTTKNNPFKIEDRKFPIDYPYPEIEYIIIDLEIPEGYQVQELPKNISAVTPDKSCAFIFNFSVIGNKLKIMHQFKVLKTLFLPTEYKTLKQFFEILIKKQSEKIVLTKKA